MIRKQQALAVLGALLVLGFTVYGGAQERGVVQSAPKPVVPQEKTGAPKTTSSKDSPDFSKESLVYEQVRGKLRYEEDGTGVMGIQARIRVQSYAGVQRLGQLIFSYQSANEKLEIRTVRVTKSNGKIVTAGAEAVQDMTSPVAQEAPTYSDQRQKHVVVPSLSPGDILEYETLATFEHPLTPGHFWQAWNFISDDICLDEQVELNVPLKTNLKTVVDFGPQSETKVESERRIYIWKSSNLQHAQPEPPEISNEFDVVRLLRGQRSALGRRLFLTSFDNWGEISSWYAGLEKDRRAPTTEVKAKADEVVRDAHSDLEKVRAIYEYVAKNIRYVSLSFGQGRYQPHFAAEVLAHEYGDCKDKATLLESMLDAEGIKAWPVLLQTNWDVQPDMPNPLEFDHVISYLRVDEKDIWLDSTLGVAPFEYLLPQVRGKHALLVKPGPAAGLVQIPEALQTPTLYRLAVDGSLDEARKVEAQMTFETRGDAEVLLRLGLTQVPLAKLTEIMAAAARQSDKTTDISFTDLEATDPFDTSKPLRFSMKISGTLPEETSGKETKAQPDNPFDASELGFILPFFVQVKDKSFQGYLGGPKEMQLNVKFSLPAKYADKLKPAKASPAKITKDFAEYEGKWSWDGKTLEGEWRLGLKAKEIQNDQIADYMDFRTQVLARLSEFSSKLTGKEGHFRAAEMVGRYSEAMSAQRKGKDGEAVKILQELVKEDPKYTDAWRSLGQVEEKRKNWAKSREAYEKVMELEPGSYSGYEGVIRAYSGQWRYDEAIAIAKKEVEKVTGQANGHMELGWLYLQTEKYALAVPEYEAVVKLLPKSPRMQIQLGQAYAGAHEREKAEAAFDKAVELDQSAPILNDAAYYSAEAGADLRKAENWSRKAVDEIEKKAGEVKLEETNLATAGLLGTLAAYWDTLGWIEFKKGNLATAEKYLRAACDLTDAGTIQMHMGRVYEAEQRKEEAIYAYSRTLLPTTDRFFALDAASGQTRELRRPLIPDEREATSHLAALLGGESKVAELLKEASYNRNWKRTVTTPNRDGRDYWVHLITMVGPGPKIEDMRKLQGTEDEKTLLERFHGDTPPQSFPDTNLRRIPRVANIHCLKEPAQCELAFLPIEHWQGEFSEIKEGESTGTMQK